MAKTNNAQLMDDASRLASSVVDQSVILTRLLAGDPDSKYVEALFCGFWPFVLGFQFAAKEVVQKCLLTANERLASLSPDQIAFLASRRDALASISDDEHSHMNMWLTASEAAGFGYRYLDEWQKLPAVLALRHRIINENALSDQMIFVLGVELLAGAFSEKVLASNRARTVIGDAKLAWFNAHVSHGDFSHASLALDAAIFFGDDAVTSGHVLSKLDEFCSLYLLADAACVKCVNRLQATPARSLV